MSYRFFLGECATTIKYLHMSPPTQFKTAVCPSPTNHGIMHHGICARNLDPSVQIPAIIKLRPSKFIVKSAAKVYATLRARFGAFYSRPAIVTSMIIQDL